MTQVAVSNLYRTRAAGPAATDACDSVICFAGVDWWYHNRGHSECQIMSKLARRVPALWINSIGMRAPAPGKTELPYRRYVRKLKSTLKGLRRDPSGMWIYSPLFVPRYTPRMVEFNGRVLAAQVRGLCRLLGFARPAVMVTIPTAAPAVAHLRPRRLVFNRSDEFSAFREADASFVRPLEHRLLCKSDVVLYVNRGLYQREQHAVRDAQYIGHGVDFKHFARDAEASAQAPSALKDLPRPIIGFYGALDDYTIDLELLIKVAQANRSASVVIIGPRAMDISRLVAEPNVKYLGPIPYAELPRYAAQFDVALMPWLQNEWIAGCNPIKLKEYLALGMPVVTTRFAELQPFEHLVYAADSHEQYLAAIQRGLAERDPQRVAQRRQAVRTDSWDAIADRVGGMLKLG
jgi:glycosyltransferase involved in cell wall biosynthesis